MHPQMCVRVRTAPGLAAPFVSSRTVTGDVDEDGRVAPPFGVVAVDADTGVERVMARTECCATGRACYGDADNAQREVGVGLLPPWNSCADAEWTVYYVDDGDGKDIDDELNYYANGVHVMMILGSEEEHAMSEAEAGGCVNAFVLTPGEYPNVDAVTDASVPDIVAVVVVVDAFAPAVAAADASESADAYLEAPAAVVPTYSSAVPLPPTVVVAMMRDRGRVGTDAAGGHDDGADADGSGAG
jgi:hypothetical protein